MEFTSHNTVGLAQCYDTAVANRLEARCAHPLLEAVLKLANTEPADYLMFPAAENRIYFDMWNKVGVSSLEFWFARA